jgi:hypothetical protein
MAPCITNPIQNSYQRDAAFTYIIHNVIRDVLWLSGRLAESYLSVRLSAWNNSAPTGRFFMKFDIWIFFENLLRKFKFHCNRTRIKGTLHEDQYTFLIVSHSFLLRMEKVSNKSCIENRHTHFMLSNFLFFESRAPLWDNVEKFCRAGQVTQNTIWRTRIACWIPKATNTHTGCAIIIVFILQHWSHERSSILRYT